MRIVVVLRLMVVVVIVVLRRRRPRRPRGERRVRVDVVADEVGELFVVVSPVAKRPGSWGTCGAPGRDNERVQWLYILC